MASLLRTAEELRIKGLAEVSWNDENGDGKRNKIKSQNVRSMSHLNSLNETAITATKLQNQQKRHSTSSNNSINHFNAIDIDPLADTATNHIQKDADDVAQITKSTANISIPSTNSPPRDETLQPVKKKRG